MPRYHQVLKMADSLVGPIVLAMERSNHLSGPGATLSLVLFSADRTSAGVIAPRDSSEGSRRGVTSSRSGFDVNSRRSLKVRSMSAMLGVSLEESSL